MYCPAIIKIFFSSFLFCFNNYLTINYKVFNNKVKKVRVSIRASSSSLNIYHSTLGVCASLKENFNVKKNCDFKQSHSLTKETCEL